MWTPPRATRCKDASIQPDQHFSREIGGVPAMELWPIVRIHPGTPEDAIGPDLQGRTPSSARQQGSTAAGTGNQAHGGATVPHPGAKPFVQRVSL